MPRLNLPYPFTEDASAWELAFRLAPEDVSLSLEAERKAAQTFARRHELFADRSREAIRTFANLYKARVLLRFKEGLSAHDLMAEYKPLHGMFMRDTDFDGTLSLQLDELEETDVHDVVKILKELVGFDQEANM